MISTKEDILKEFSLNKEKHEVEIRCSICGTEEKCNFKRLFNIEKKQCIPKEIYCFKCVRKQAYETTKKKMLEKYGVENPFQRQDVKDKMKKTCLERYGVEYSGASKKRIEKQKKTFAKKSKEEKAEIVKKIQAHMTPEKKQKAKEKARKTCLEKYGEETPFAYGSQTFKNLMIERFGVEHSMQAQQTKDKVTKTCLDRYGTKRFAGSRSYYKQMLDEYGTLHPGSIRYKVDNLNFDSTWELEFYLYCRDMGFKIIREPIYFEYSYNGKKHRYYVDFEVNGKYFEIKSPFFFKNRDDSKEYVGWNDSPELAKAKWDCMMKNNVEIISTTKIKKYQDYFNKNYGIDFLIKNRIGRIPSHLST